MNHGVLQTLTPQARKDIKGDWRNGLSAHFLSLARRCTVKWLRVCPQQAVPGAAQVLPCPWAGLKLFQRSNSPLASPCVCPTPEAEGKQCISSPTSIPESVCGQRRARGLVTRQGTSFSSWRMQIGDWSRGGFSSRELCSSELIL